MELLSVLLGSVALLVLVGLFYIQGKMKSFELHLSQQLQQQQQNQQQNILEISQQLNTPFLDLTERFSRLSHETKEQIMDRLSKNATETQEKLEKNISIFRQEQHSSLQKSTQLLEVRFQSLEKQVGERLESIGKNVEAKLNANMQEGFQHFVKVQEHLKSAELKLSELGMVSQSIGELNLLLKLPHLRGGFGEATLERLLHDFLAPGTYEVQYAVVPGASERVDAAVKVSNQFLPIDSKFPREQVLPLFEAGDPAGLEQARKVLGEAIRIQAKSISEKYIRPEYGTTDMALLFLPSETLYFEVVRNAKLFEDMSKLKVFPVSPNTLAIGLKSVMIAQDYYSMAKGVEKTIEDIKKARRHFTHFERKFEDIGKGLKKAQEAFEVANTHLNRYDSSVSRLTGPIAEESVDALESGSVAALASPSQSDNIQT